MSGRWKFGSSFLLSTPSVSPEEIASWEKLECQKFQRKINKIQNRLGRAMMHVPCPHIEDKWLIK